RLHDFCEAYGIDWPASGTVPGICGSGKKADAPTRKGRGYITGNVGGWAPARFEAIEPPLLGEIKNHLLQLEKHFRIRFTNFVLWEPTREEVESIKYRVHNGTPIDARQALLGSAWCSEELITLDDLNKSETSSTSD